MLRPFWIKTKADIRSRPWPTALLLLVVASTAALPTVALSVNRITDDAYQRTLDEANGAHVWLFSDDPALLEEATRTRGVTESSGPFLRAGGSYASIEGSFDLNLWGMPDERPVVGTTNVIEGRWLAPGAADEIVIDAGFADRANLHVGDVMEVAGDGESASLRVVGLGVNTTNAPFGVEQGQVDVFVAAPVAEQFASGEHGDYAAGVRLEDPGQAGSFARQFANSQGAAPGSVNSEPGVNIGFRTYKDIQAEVAGGQQTTLIFLGAFTAFAILAAGLILANTVASQVLSQQRDIGLLKAVGMTPGSVTRLLVVQYLFVGLLAGVVGIGAGALVAPVLVGRGARLLHTTAEPVFDPVASVAVLVGVLLIVLVFSLVPALRAGRTSTLSAIAPPLHGVGRASLARVAGRLRLPLPVTVALKDAFARPARSWLTIAALTLAAATATAALTMESTLNRMASDPLVVGEPDHELLVERSNDAEWVGIRQDETGASMSHQELAALLDANDSVEAWGHRLAVPAQTDPGRDYLLGRALEGDPEALGYSVASGRFFAAPGEAVVGLGLARDLGLRPGDTLRLQLDAFRRQLLGVPGESPTLDLHIVGTYVDSENSGGVVMFSFETLRTAIPDPATGAYLVKLMDGTDVRQAAFDIVRAAGGRVSTEDLEADFERDLTDIRSQLRSVMWPLSATLLLTATVNLLATLLFAIREQSRDLAILKTIGFTPRQLVLSVVAGATCFMVIALAVGGPAGYFAMSQLAEYFAREEGWPSGVAAVPDSVWLIALIPVALLVAAIGAALPAREVARTSASETLRLE